MRTTPAQDVELAALAAAAERRNRPRLMLYGAIVLLVGSGVYAAGGSGAVARARSQAQSAAAQAVQVEALAAEIGALLASREQSDAATRFPPDARLRSKLVEIATAVGLPGTIEPDARMEQRGLDYPLQKQVVTVNLSDAPLEPTLRFISRATEEIDGLYVDTIQLRVVPQGWFSVIRFARWEVKR